MHSMRLMVYPNFRRKQPKYSDSEDRRMNGNSGIRAMICISRKALLVSSESVRVTSKMLSETTRRPRSSWGGD
jgi:hypothetical protein